MPRNEHIFTYNHLMPRTPPVTIYPATREYTCACGAEFTTASRTKYRCDACQAAADERARVRAIEKRKRRK